MSVLVKYAEIDEKFSNAIDSVFDRLKLLGTGAPGNKIPDDLICRVSIICYSPHSS